MGNEIDRLLANNDAWVKDFAFGELPIQPAKPVVIITCLDARMDPAWFLGLEPGDAHVIRNAGGLVTEDMLRSLTVSQHLLGTREVMVVQHTGCGLEAYSDDDIADRVTAGTGVQPAGGFGAFTDLEASVRDGVQRVRSHPELLHRDAVRGFIYDIRTGTLREVST